jgi:hypothetical protein
MPVWASLCGSDTLVRLLLTLLQSAFPRLQEISLFRFWGRVYHLAPYPPPSSPCKILKTIELRKTGLQNLDSEELRGQNLQNKGVSSG